MTIHLIAIGGAIMHNLAIVLKGNNHTVTGSDDEIYDPAKDRLLKNNLLPEKVGWDEQHIHQGIDLVILGMHARHDNPELLKAKSLNIQILSFPEYIFLHAIDKIRIVVAGSHGKTTTTAMIMHLLQALNQDFDYLVGAQLEGFENMVKLSRAPIMVIEGDEYLSSAIDQRPKFLHYQPHITIITGIAHDHINVFPTLENYEEQFQKFVDSHQDNAKIYYFEEDFALQRIMQHSKTNAVKKAYSGFEYIIQNNNTTIIDPDLGQLPITIFGKHNTQNLHAAFLVSQALGLSKMDTWPHLATFLGAAKRLQLIENNDKSSVYLDFAHAPSKVKATTHALKKQFPNRQLIAAFQLHTFSSLDSNFIHNYQKTLDQADIAIVFVDQHTLKIKQKQALPLDLILRAFDHPNLKVIQNAKILNKTLRAFNYDNVNLLLMSSGNFGGIKINNFLSPLK